MNIRQCNDQQEWDDYVLDNSGHPLQLWGWGELKQKHNWQAERLFCLNDDKIVGAASVLIRKIAWPIKSIAYIPRGPVGEQSKQADVLEVISDYIRTKHSSTVLTIEPDSIDINLPADWRKTTNTILPKRTILLDLTKSEDELMGDMAKKTRQYIRKSMKEDFIIKTIKTEEEMRGCLDVYHKTAERAGFALHSDNYYLDAFKTMGDHNPIFAAYHGDKPIAFLWLAISAKTAYELYGGMDEQGRIMRANFALKWHAITKCKEWGLDRYDFGGLIQGGVSTFKMGWAREEIELAGSYDRPLSKAYIIWDKGLPLAKKIIRKISKLISR